MYINFLHFAIVFLATFYNHKLLDMDACMDARFKNPLEKVHRIWFTIFNKL